MERIVLDVHAHLIPVEGLAAAGLDGVAWDANDETLTLDGHTHRQRSLYRPDELLAWMDRNGVQTAWISLPPFGYRSTIEAAGASGWLTFVNDGLLALSSRFPARFQPLFHLPVEHPALAEKCARGWIEAGQPRFSMACGDGKSIVLSDAAYEPLWRALDGGKAFVFLHPPESCDPRLAQFHLHNLVGNPTETAIAASHLVLGGVIDRFPNMRICLAHGGGTTAAIAGRLERGRLAGRPGMERHAASLREKMRHFCVDCIVHDGDAFRLAVDVHGQDNILFGSDWPFPMGMPEPHLQLADIDPAMRRRIFQDNPDNIARIYSSTIARNAG